VAIRNIRYFKLKDKIIEYMIKLNDDYHGVSSPVLLLEAMPQINIVFHDNTTRKKNAM